MLLSEHIDKLKQFSKAIVALDPDAMVKTIEYTRLLRSNGIDCFAMNLYDDLKYRTPDDIQSLQQLLGADIGTRSTQVPIKQRLL
jgi:murein L,D-transpeptidase YcbB/YkuD